MVLYNVLFKPRKLPDWWRRFTDNNPAVGSAVAVAGLVWICFSIAPIVNSAERHGQGELIETIGVISWSQRFMDNAHSLRSAYQELFPEQIRLLASLLYSNIAIYLIVPFLMLLELLFPCRTSQPLIGKGFLQDAIWFVALSPARVFVLFPVATILRTVFNEYLPFLAIHSALEWPLYWRVIAAVFLGELLAWVNHYLRHRIRPLWYFHAVHHSQKELNVFTDDRAHVVDLLVGSLLAYLPFFIFHVPNLYALTVIVLYMAIHNRFIHANVKINLGWLGWVFASPQFHRVHHSADINHRDTNFGRTLSVFDHLFATAFKSRDIYPETGIDDMQFPDEGKVRLLGLPINWLTQTLYPFLQFFPQRIRRMVWWKKAELPDNEINSISQSPTIAGTTRTSSPTPTSDIMV